jgi:hypothetical protein
MSYRWFLTPIRGIKHEHKLWDSRWHRVRVWGNADTRIFAGPAARLTGGEVNTKMNTHTNIRGVVCSTAITSIFWPFAE